jgi:UDP-GlcNAc:undecaprenyl-phosphate GlcNAc-1-phosphate transferase
MGDSGSGFLGFSLAVLSIMSATKAAALFSMLVPIIILAVPIFDTAFAIIRRLMSGKSPFEADKKHLHHRILDKGYSNRNATLIIYGVTIILSIIAVISTNIADKYLPYLFISALIVFAVFLWQVGILKELTIKK